MRLTGTNPACTESSNSKKGCRHHSGSASDGCTRSDGGGYVGMGRGVLHDLLFDSNNSQYCIALFSRPDTIEPYVHVGRQIWPC